MGNESLRIPAVTNIGESKNAEIYSKWETADAVEAELHSVGLAEKPRPTFACPNITPEMLTGLEGAAYSHMYAEVLAWFNYTATLLARADARILQYKNIMETTESSMRNNMKDTSKALGEKAPSAEYMSDTINIDYHYQNAKLELQKYKQYKDIVKAHLDGIERSLAVVSRQIEIKKLEYEATRAQGNFSNREHPFPSRRPGR